MYRIEALAKTGETDEADKLLKKIPHSQDPDLYYLKGLI
jgi:pentatricopeptide repeat protein